MHELAIENRKFKDMRWIEHVPERRHAKIARARIDFHPRSSHKPRALTATQLTSPLPLREHNGKFEGSVLGCIKEKMPRTIS